MKKNIIISAFFSVISLFILSCENENETENTTADVSIEAYTTEPSTRTSLNGDDTEGYKVEWTKGDKITIQPRLANGMKSAVTFELYEGANSTRGFFIPSTMHAAADWSWPEITSVEALYGLKDFEWPSVQNYMGEGNISYAPMRYQGNTNGVKPVLHFKNAGGILRLNIYSDRKIAEIKITANEKISGPIDHFTSAGSAVINQESGSNTITLKVADLQTNSFQKTEFYIAMPSVTNAINDGEGYSGVSITITDSKGKVKTNTLKENHKLLVKRSEITDVEIVELDVNENNYAELSSAARIAGTNCSKLIPGTPGSYSYLGKVLTYHGMLRAPETNNNVAYRYHPKDYLHWGTLCPRNWMGFISDEQRICNLTIPASHDSGMGHVRAIDIRSAWGQTQLLNLPEQFAAGIRCFDIRLNEDGYAQHGEGFQSVSTSLDFEHILGAMYTCVKSYPTEGVFLLVNQEDDSLNYLLNSMTKYLTNFTNNIDDPQNVFVKFHPSITVGEMRGKICIIFKHKYFNKWDSYAYAKCDFLKLGDYNELWRTFKNGEEMYYTCQDYSGNIEAEKKREYITQYLEYSRDGIYFDFNYNRNNYGSEDAEYWKIPPVSITGHVDRKDLWIFNYLSCYTGEKAFMDYGEGASITNKHFRNVHKNYDCNLGFIQMDCVAIDDFSGGLLDDYDDADGSVVSEIWQHNFYFKSDRYWPAESGYGYDILGIYSTNNLYICLDEDFSIRYDGWNDSNYYGNDHRQKVYDP